MESRYNREDLLRILSKIQNTPGNAKREQMIRDTLEAMPEEDAESTPSATDVLEAARNLQNTETK